MPQHEHDALEIRCLQLGGPVTFGYCRKVGDGLPCRNLLGCWTGRFDVIAFLRETYSRDELKRAFAPRDKTRLQRIVELAEQARERQEPEPEPPSSRK
jgi:hypothetical protein